MFFVVFYKLQNVRLIQNKLVNSCLNLLKGEKYCNLEKF